MSIFRIMCKKSSDCAAFAELVQRAPYMVNDNYFYEDARGHVWTCTADYISGRFIAEPEVIEECCAALKLYKIKLGTGSAYIVGGDNA